MKVYFNSKTKTDLQSMKAIKLTHGAWLSSVFHIITEQLAKWNLQPFIPILIHQRQ